MYLLYNNCRDPYFNLALEEYLLKQCDDEFIVFWVNNPAVIVGRNQLTNEEVNLGYASEHSIPVVRRLSGGGAVYHDPNNLNYTFILKKGKDNGMRRLTLPIIQALESLSLPIEFSGRNDLTIHGRKFSGIAQCHFRNRILHHGTLLLTVDNEKMQSVLRVSDDKLASHGVRSVRSRVTGLNEYLATPLGAWALAERLADQLLQSLPGLLRRKLTEDQVLATKRLVDAKYSLPEWNYGIIPEATVVRKIRLSSGTLECRLRLASGHIDSVTFWGDFFGTEDIAELAELLAGTSYSRQAIACALERVPLDAYVTGLQREQLLDLLLPKD